MNHSPEDLATLYVLDQLEPRERAAFEARLLREPALASLVRELESGFAGGIHSLSPRDPPAGLLARVEQQLETPVPFATPAPAPFHWMGFARWGLAALIAVSLAILAVQSLRSSPPRPVFVLVGLDTDRNTFAELPLKNGTKDPDARFMQLASLAENLWAKPRGQPEGSDTLPGANYGYALFDPDSRQGFIAIKRLPILAETQRYHLWIVDPATERIHDAGSIPLAGMNRGLYSFTLAPQAGLETNHPRFFITVEESNMATAPARPRGKVVLGNQSI